MGVLRMGRSGPGISVVGDGRPGASKGGTKAESDRESWMAPGHVNKRE